MRKYINQVFWNDNTKKKTIKLVFHGLFCNSRRSDKSNRVTKLKTKKNMVSELKFFSVRINVYVLLYGIRSIIRRKKYRKMVYFQWKISLKKLWYLTENQGITHKGNIVWTQSYIKYDIVLKCMSLKYPKYHSFAPLQCFNLAPNQPGRNLPTYIHKQTNCIAARWTPSPVRGWICAIACLLSSFIFTKYKCKLSLYNK